MRLYVLLPLAVSALCLAWIFFTNRFARVGGAVIPDGLVLCGDVVRPVLQYDGHLVLGGTHGFEAVRCRSLRIARGAHVRAGKIEAGRVLVEGALSGVRSLSAAKILEVRGGDLQVDDVQAPLVRVDARGKAIVLTVSGESRLVRHPRADVRGFFANLDEAVAVGAAARLSEWRNAETAGVIRH